MSIVWSTAFLYWEAPYKQTAYKGNVFVNGLLVKTPPSSGINSVVCSMFSLSLPDSHVLCDPATPSCSISPSPDRSRPPSQLFATSLVNLAVYTVQAHFNSFFDRHYASCSCRGPWPSNLLIFCLNFVTDRLQQVKKKQPFEQVHFRRQQSAHSLAVDLPLVLNIAIMFVETFILPRLCQNLPNSEHYAPLICRGAAQNGKEKKRHCINTPPPARISWTSPPTQGICRPLVCIL